MRDVKGQIIEPGSWVQLVGPAFSGKDRGKIRKVVGPAEMPKGVVLAAVYRKVLNDNNLKITDIAVIEPHEWVIANQVKILEISEKPFHEIIESLNC